MLPLLLYVLAVGAVIGAALVASWFIGSKARHGGARTLPFESGILPVGDAEEVRLSIEFYLIAVFFVIFDLETIFIIAWAVAFHDVGWRGYIGASVFIVILLAALFYEWRTGALDWGIKSRLARPGRYARREAAAAEGA
jgi:NADH-quinone oxidoreductase subunit A